MISLHHAMRGTAQHSPIHQPNVTACTECTAFAACWHTQHVTTHGFFPAGYLVPDMPGQLVAPDLRIADMLWVWAASAAVDLGWISR